jgi:hypothetical protein
MGTRGVRNAEKYLRLIFHALNLGPVYTKKPERVEALGYIFLMVLLLAKYLIPKDVLKMIRRSGFDEQIYICGYSQDLFTKIMRPK